MEFRHLGSSGFKVPVFGLGANIFGHQKATSHFTDPDETARIIHRAEELGANFIDTSNSYTGGDSETFIGRAVADRRHKFIIASKVGWEPNHLIAQGYRMGPNEAGLSRGHIMDSIDGTLSRLGTDYVDLYYAHKPDPGTPWDETLRAFDDLVRTGKVRYIACSNFAGWQIAAMSEISGHNGYTPLVASQSLYNLFERRTERDVVPACLHYGLSLLPYSPLAQGVLTGKYRAGEPAPKGTRGYGNTSERFRALMAPERLSAIANLDRWSQDHGYRVGDLALAWLLAQPGVSSVINAVTSIEQLEANVRATGWQLDASQLSEVEKEIGNLADR
ncbi:MAG: aldo/keto reductase [Caldilineaceae bacterium]|nr:aldo/keto reductase [Caldilineaceae bacterium]